jgi:integrase
MSAAAPPPLGPFSSPLAGELTRFLHFKRAAGYRYREEARLLQDLDRCLAGQLAPTAPVITRDRVRAYVARRGQESETTRAHRLSWLRQRCRFLALEEPRTALPARGFLGIYRRPFVPRGLTRAEGRRFLRAGARLPAGRCSPLRGVVHGTALRLLYLTGLRAGEARRLTLGDVDLAPGRLQIRGTKFGTSRRVPLAPDLTARLARCTLGVWRSSFRLVLAAAGIARQSGGRRLRLHDLRHSFASLRLLLWCEQGADLGAKLPLLATYLGHVGLASSPRYLQLTEDLLGEVTRRHQARFGYLITERRTP